MGQQPGPTSALQQMEGWDPKTVCSQLSEPTGEPRTGVCLSRLPTKHLWLLLKRSFHVSVMRHWGCVGVELSVQRGVIKNITACTRASSSSHPIANFPLLSP